MLRLSYISIEAHRFWLGKTWVLSALEDGELEFITHWIQYK